MILGIHYADPRNNSLSSILGLRSPEVELSSRSRGTTISPRVFRFVRFSSCAIPSLSRSSLLARADSSLLYFRRLESTQDIVALFNRNRNPFSLEPNSSARAQCVVPPSSLSDSTISERAVPIWWWVVVVRGSLQNRNTNLPLVELNNSCEPRKDRMEIKE
jgi:hypothetical protein